MVKKIILSLIITIVFSISCVTVQQITPTYYLDDLPQDMIIQLTLDERIAIEDAWASLRIGKIKDALKILQKMDQNKPATWLGYAYTALFKGDYIISEQWFKKVLEIYPDLPIVHYGLAEVYRNQGREEEAFAEYKKVWEKEPDHEWAKYYWELIKKNKTEELLKQADFFWKQNQFDKASEIYIKVLYYSPELPEPHLRLAEYYKNLGDYEKALKHYEKAHSLQPENLNIKEELAESYILKKKYKEAYNLYQELVKIDPENSKYRERLDYIKNELLFIELPRQFYEISSKEAINRADLAALIAVKFSNILGKEKRKPPIIVDIATHWAAHYIIEVTSLGIMDVFPNHTFQPEKTLTRGELAIVLSKLIDFLTEKGYKLYKQFSPDEIQLSDVAPDHFIYQPIIKVLCYQLMDLFPGFEFKPFLEVNGKEAETIIETLERLIK
ncbi:tetratricopeptide repeat protein [Candidatus Aminicenantes bacterium AC-335-A11]|jgi:tetratricopeptide (TPR) repeat protein|nr:tetratricopeptide repeat protein [SCandidatus Aminicenantes bacterium Aminicenantia_JdfR_composite]MCP2597925.1 tetratricopeptide repeat protein [Candidatus Aminicenantes bacterium AC-335-L06]MCP2605880.1 tetratricopeptide repeat protein [Candidatus Aminicenantes bacterium AC-335-O07]MCP2606093.1 tetratricopeptide repeat protein [Candidatus Aminicenantes bacterium AC-708-I09]MCP2618823.1 tetratricopeptide repeat protein [Candidatus Aminicenantes bacterium AC-335-A11]